MLVAVFKQEGSVMKEQIRPNNSGVVVFESPVQTPEVSVIVVTYNQEWNKLVKTLESIVVQEDIAFEVLVCDDGSEKQFGNELTQFFTENGFVNYKLIFHDYNEGTVSNYYSGLLAARGKYSKLLGAGDYLAGRKTLYKWVQFMKNNSAKWSFSDTLYYRSVDEKDVLMSAKAWPQIITPYIRKDTDACMWNYVVLHDIANGASILGETSVQKYYCKIIKEKGIRYCEDHIYQLMMFRGNVGAYYSEPAVFYEYGAGISSFGNREWRSKMLDDRRKLVQLMMAEKGDSALKDKMVGGLIRYSKSNKINKLLTKGKLSLWMKRRFFPRLSSIQKEVEG